MGDRFGMCKTCLGQGITTARDPVTFRKLTKECGTCGGTGESGSAIDHLEREQALEPEER